MTNPLDSEIVDQIRQLGGSKLLSDLVGVYLEHTPKRLEALAAGVREGDATRIEKAAHSIRSSSISLGARTLASEAAALEEMAKARSPAELSQPAQRLEADVVALLEYLRTEFDGSRR